MGDLYHFTQSANIPSIRVHGLRSWAELDRLGIKYSPSSNRLSRDLDSFRHLEHYVRLCVGDRHPMADSVLRAGRVPDLVWLEVDSSVMEDERTRYCATNAARTTVKLSEDPAVALESPDRQAEVLVWNRILPFRILNIGEL